MGADAMAHDAGALEMKDMAESVAKAMFEESHEERWDEATEIQRGIYLADAEVAIKAMDQWRFRAAGISQR